MRTLLVLLLGSVVSLNAFGQMPLDEVRSPMSEGRYREAAALLEPVVASEPDNAVAWNALSSASNYGENYVRANEAAERAVALEPANLAYRFNRALTRWEAGRFQDALADYDWVLAQRPGSANALTERGATLAALGRFDEAEASWRASLETDPNYAWAHYYRGQAAMAHGRYADAAHDFGRVLEKENFYPARLWSWAAHRRAGLAPPELPRDTSWPGQIGAYLRGDMDAAALESAARQNRLDVDDRRMVAALYFIAQREISEGRPAAARAALDRVLALETPLLPERMAALMERERLR
jgi:tetratricopeptide (TPR) repeat protein